MRFLFVFIFSGFLVLNSADLHCGFGKFVKKVGRKIVNVAKKINENVSISGPSLEPDRPAQTGSGQVGDKKISPQEEIMQQEGDFVATEEERARKEKEEIEKGLEREKRSKKKKIELKEKIKDLEGVIEGREGDKAKVETGDKRKVEQLRKSWQKKEKMQKKILHEIEEEFDLSIGKIFRQYKFLYEKILNGKLEVEEEKLFYDIKNKGVKLYLWILKDLFNRGEFFEKISEQKKTEDGFQLGLASLGKEIFNCMDRVFSDKDHQKYVQYKKRIVAIEETLKFSEILYQTYDLGFDVQAPCIRDNFDLGSFIRCKGNKVELDIHGDLVNIINDAASLFNAYSDNFHINHIVSIVFKMSNLVLNANSNKEYKKAYAFLDFCFALLNVGKEFTEIIQKGFDFNLCNIEAGIFAFNGSDRIKDLNLSLSMFEGLIQKASFALYDVVSVFYHDNESLNGHILSVLSLGVNASCRSKESIVAELVSEKCSLGSVLLDMVEIEEKMIVSISGLEIVLPFKKMFEEMIRMADNKCLR